jgi:hypothetical protein
MPYSDTIQWYIRESSQLQTFSHIIYYVTQNSWPLPANRCHGFYHMLTVWCVQWEKTAQKKYWYTGMSLFWLRSLSPEPYKSRCRSRPSWKNYQQVLVVTNTYVKAALFVHETLVWNLISRLDRHAEHSQSISVSTDIDLIHWFTRKPTAYTGSNCNVTHQMVRQRTLSEIYKW